MKSKVAATLLVIVLPLLAGQWQVALPGYHYEFPRDHFSHPEYQTEWWYYTGNLRANDGHRFGFELTFFRQATATPKQAAEDANNIWSPDQIYLAHLALSDIDGKSFYHTERLNRAGPGLAGAAYTDHRYWNGNWQVRWLSTSSNEQELQAVCDRFTLRLQLNPSKPFVIQGKNGISQKGPEPGKASHYISFTRIAANGQLTYKDRQYSLSGLAWMDHEFFTEQLDPTQAGWDWFAIQLNNNEELMLYRLRKKSGQGDPYSSGTYIDARGNAHFLDSTQLSFSSDGKWTSPQSGTSYPMSWQIRIPILHLELSEQTALKDQELFSKNSVTAGYWEGAVTYDGRIHSQPVTGVGYLEMTGYGQPLTLGYK